MFMSENKNFFEHARGIPMGKGKIASGSKVESFGLIDKGAPTPLGSLEGDDVIQLSVTENGRTSLESVTVDQFINGDRFSNVLGSKNDRRLWLDKCSWVPRNPYDTRTSPAMERTVAQFDNIQDE